MVTSGPASFTSLDEIHDFIGPGSYDLAERLRSSRAAITCPETYAADFSVPNETVILHVSRMINVEATSMLCARNKFHYFAFRSFLRHEPWPVPFSTMQLSWIKTLSLNYCNSHYLRWTNDTANAIDECIASKHCSGQHRLSVTREFLSLHFLNPTSYSTISWPIRHRSSSSLALKQLGKRLNSLDTISALLPGAMRVFGQTIALGSTWGIEDWDTSAIPKITFSNWWLDGVERRRNRARDWHY